MCSQNVHSAHVRVQVRCWQFACSVLFLRGLALNWQKRYVRTANVDTAAQNCVGQRAVGEFSKYSVRVVRTCSGASSCKCILCGYHANNCCTRSVITDSRRVAGSGLVGCCTVASGQFCIVHVLCRDIRIQRIGWTNCVFYWQIVTARWRSVMPPSSVLRNPRKGF